MGQLAQMKPKSATEKRTSTTLDTMVLTPEMIAKFKLPSGQRPLRENAKVRAVAEQIKQDGGVLPGVITLGKLEGEYYIIDGQHRIHAFRMSGLKEGYADVRLLHAESIRDIHQEFVELNSRLVQMRPDDFLRGMEDLIPTLQLIRKSCPFVGYDQIRRGSNGGPIISMSVVLRAWKSSATEAPSSAGSSAVVCAETITEEESRQLVQFLLLARDAFGRDFEFRSLWSGINLVLCMWLYRRLVIVQYSPKTPRIDGDVFKKCLMSLSAESQYLDWLVGRQLGERDRTPAYNRIKAVFVKRIGLETRKAVALPAPSWSK